MKKNVCGVSWTRTNYLVCNVAQRKFPILLLPLSLFAFPDLRFQAHNFQLVICTNLVVSIGVSYSV